MRNKRKNLFSKWMAFCLTLIMAITMALPVQANVGADTTYSLTVTGKESDAGAAVDVYRLIKINFDTVTQQAKEPFYEWESAVATWLKENEHANYVGENDNRVTETYTELGAADLSNLMKELQAAISSSALTLTKAVSGALTSENNYQLTSDTMDMGIYLILTTPDANGEHKGHEYAPATANIVPVYREGNWNVDDAEVVIKGSPSSIEKEVNDHTVAIGDVLEYTITAPVPTYPKDAVAKMFRIGDKLPKGITFEESYEQNNLTVYAVYENEDDVQIGTSSNQDKTYFEYHFNKKDCGQAGIKDLTDSISGREASFILAFDYDKLIEGFGTSDAGNALKEIKVTYHATVNEHAFEDDALENSAYVGQNDPYDASDYDTTTEDREKVFTYGIEITKVEKGVNAKLLSGAKFMLFQNKDDVTDDSKAVKFVKDDAVDGQYRKAKAEEIGVTELVVGETDARKGKLNLNGLATGTYYLKEIKAPDGYELLKDPIEITLKDAQAEHGGDGAGILDEIGDAAEGTLEANIFYQTVENSKPPIMPVTGGMGTILFTIVGVVLVAGGLTLIVTYMRRRHS